MEARITDEALQTGAMIGRYEILSKIAAGGMATVYLGRAHAAAGFERLVALKVCHAHLAQDAESVERFLAEARLAARIHHPNVVATLDVVNEGQLCIVMEYVEGGSLAALLMAARDGAFPMPPPIALRIVSDLLAGLHAAHVLQDASGRPLELVHRDVTPQNVLVGSDGIARIADFGILKTAGGKQLTAAGSVRGKLPYLAPEQFQPGAPTRAVDIYAAGVVLWESLTGERLFKAESEAELMEQILHRPRPLASARMADIPPELDALIGTAMDRDPRKRFGTAAAFAEALEGAQVPLASTREVAAFVNELLGAELEQRRAQLVRVTQEFAPPAPPVDRTLVTEAPLGDETPRPRTTVSERPSAREAEQLPTAVFTNIPTAVTQAEARAASRRWLVAPMLALVGAAALFLALRHPAPPEPPPLPVVAIPEPAAVEPSRSEPAVKHAELPAPPPVRTEPATLPAPSPQPAPVLKAAPVVDAHHVSSKHHRSRPTSTRATPSHPVDKGSARPSPYDPDTL